MLNLADTPLDEESTERAKEEWKEIYKKRRVLELWTFCYNDKDKKLRTDIPIMSEKNFVIQNHRDQLIRTARALGLIGTDEEILKKVLTWDGEI